MDILDGQETNVTFHTMLKLNPTSDFTKQNYCPRVSGVQFLLQNT